MRFFGIVYKVLVAVDKFGNRLIGGDPRETISSRFGREIKDPEVGKTPKVVCKILDVFDKDHCEEAAEDAPGLPQTETHCPSCGKAYLYDLGVGAVICCDQSPLR